MSTKERKQRALNQATEDRLAAALDELAAFQEFKAEFLPQIRADLRAKKSAREIMQKYSAMAAARMVMVALTAADPTKAASAAKDIMDRAEGKATEKVEVQHKYGELKDDELDALLESKLKEANGAVTTLDLTKNPKDH